jgi:hypothetical protein
MALAVIATMGMVTPAAHAGGWRCSRPLTGMRRSIRIEPAHAPLKRQSLLAVIFPMTSWLLTSAAVKGHHLVDGRNGA